MNKVRTLTWLVLLALVASACAVDQTAGTTTPEPTTVASDSTQATTGTSAPSGRSVEMLECEDAPSEVSIVCEAYELIQTHYVDDVSDDDLSDAAGTILDGSFGSNTSETLVCALPTEGFAESCGVAADLDLDSETAAELMVIGLASHALDANSTYFDEESLELLEEEQEGEIEGIGALVTPEDQTIEGDNKLCGVVSETCRIIIVSTIPGAPAEAAGIQRDDAIVGVNGESIDGWTIDEVTSQVRGPKGTDVVLTIDRGGESLDIAITRAAVIIPVIASERVGSNGYIQLSIFSDNADEQFREAVLDLLAEDVDTLIVDFRDNPGGLLSTAIEIASVFLEDGNVIVTQSPDDEKPYPVTGAAIVPDDVELVVLVNRGSASASEVVSAVLQERGRATVIGENTFGKNTVQQRFSLSNGGALKLTIARWLTPEGLDFGGVGVTPDVVMDIDRDLDVEALIDVVLDAA